MYLFQPHTYTMEEIRKIENELIEFYELLAGLNAEDIPMMTHSSETLSVVSSSCLSSPDNTCLMSRNTASSFVSLAKL